MKQIFFFATPTDIAPVLKRVESNAPLKFVEGGTKATPNRAIYLQSEQLPNLGTATHETGSLSNGYMVSLRDTLNHMRTSITRNGETRWNLFSCDTEEAVSLVPAGLWKDMLLPGCMDTMHNNPASQRLMKWFLSALKAEGFTKVDLWWLGKDALQMLNSGRRLSKTAEQSPPEFDLRPEHVNAPPNHRLKPTAAKSRGGGLA